MTTRILPADALQRPEISVVIAARNVRGTIRACLDSLRAQDPGVAFEVIVVDSSTDGSEQLIAEAYPEVQLLHFAERKFCGGARNAGITEARAEIIALIDADCVADPGWIHALHAAHQGADLVVGGAIANANPDSLVGWAAYFCEFSAWLPGGRVRQLDDMAGANLSYKREAFDRFGAFIEGTYCSDSEFHWRLAEQGERPRFVPGARVAHRNIDRLGTLLRHEFEHGRSFARVRGRHQSFSTLRSLVHTLGTPLLPSRLVGKQLGNLARTPGHLGHYLKAWPLTLAATSSWALGEGVGYSERFVRSRVPRFTHLVLKPTLRCTAHCATCGSRQELHRQQRRDAQLGLADWQRLFDEVDALGNRQLTLSGGEPMLVPGLPQLIEEGKRRGWQVGLNTNGSLASESMVQRLLDAGLDAVMLSMYSATPEVHDAMRSHPGLWDKACAAVRRFRQQSRQQGRALAVNLQTLLCRDNYRQFPELLELALDLEVDGVLFSYLEGDFEQRRQLLDEEQLRAFDARIRPRALEVLQRGVGDPWARRIATARLRGLYPGLRGREAAYARGEYRAARPCPTPSHFSIVLASGDVHPCNMVEYSHRPVMGNLREHSFTEQWQGAGWAAFRARGFDLCRFCPVPLQVYLPLRGRPRLASLEYALARGVGTERGERFKHLLKQGL